MNSESLINAILAGNGENAAQMFNAALSSKLSDALDVKKVEIASNLISPAPAAAEAPVETVVNETEG